MFSLPFMKRRKKNLLYSQILMLFIIFRFADIGPACMMAVLGDLGAVHLGRQHFLGHFGPPLPSPPVSKCQIFVDPPPVSMCQIFMPSPNTQ